jgi:hypothetical protein
VIFAPAAAAISALNYFVLFVVSKKVNNAVLLIFAVAGLTFFWFFRFGG